MTAATAPTSVSRIFATGKNASSWGNDASTVHPSESTNGTGACAASTFRVVNACAVASALLSIDANNGSIVVTADASDEATTRPSASTTVSAPCDRSLRAVKQLLERGLSD